MLPWMKRAESPVEAISEDRNRVAGVPDGLRVYAVGDIHGRADLLDELHHMIRNDAADWEGDRIIVYLGDYIDRGMHNREVLDTLVHHPLAGFRSIHLIGNHEAVLLQFLQDAEIARDWLSFGGETVSVTMPDSARSALTSGQFDALAQLLARKDDIAVTASKLPYLNSFAAS